jgi:hypothetical protein
MEMGLSEGVRSSCKAAWLAKLARLRVVGLKSYAHAELKMESGPKGVPSGPQRVTSETPLCVSLLCVAPRQLHVWQLIHSPIHHDIPVLLAALWQLLLLAGNTGTR